MRFSPKIRNGKLIKLSYRVKVIVKIPVFVLSIWRAFLIETGERNGDLYQSLTLVAMVPGAFMLLDMLTGAVFGGERSITTLIGKCAYQGFTAGPVPFEPVDGLVHAIQEFAMGVEMGSWSFTIPLVHSFHGITVTSSWLLPLISSLVVMTYTTAAIHWKCCPAALLVGKFRVKFFGPLQPYRFSDNLMVKGLSYSIWGPFFIIPGNDATTKPAEETV